MALRRTILLLLMASTLWTANADATEPAAKSAEAGPCPRTFEFVTPDDWRCEEEAAPQCTVCRNRSLHYTELLIRCTRDDTQERVNMQPGGRMSICGGQAM